MKNYANVCWTIDDVINNSKGIGIHIKQSDAKKILILKEKHIIDAMLSAGWQIIENSVLKKQ